MGAKFLFGCTEPVRCPVTCKLSVVAHSRCYGPTLHKRGRQVTSKGVHGKGREHVKWDMYAFKGANCG